MYTVLNYGEMAADSVRMDAYARAIARAVKPGCVVVDIGAGTGIFSLLAARAGARQVHAVEPNPAVWVLADVAREAGLSERIVVHHRTSYELELPEKADVIVSDLRGSVPLHEEHLAALRDARARLLAPGGVLLPARDELFVAAVESEPIARSLARGARGFERRGFAAESIHRSVLNSPIRDGGEISASHVVSTAAAWATVVYGESSGPFEGEVELRARRGGTIHALALWFAATIFEDLGFTTEPGTASVYSRLLLPVQEPVDVEPGDRIRVIVRADETGQRWAWETAFTTASGETRSRQRQSTFFGMPTSPEALLRSSSSFAPERSIRGERVRQALELMDGARSVAEIASAIAASPNAANVPRDVILDEVRDLVARYGR